MPSITREEFKKLLADALPKDGDGKLLVSGVTGGGGTFDGTISDGADVAQGSRDDLPAASDTATATLLAFAKRHSQQLSALIAAATANSTPTAVYEPKESERVPASTAAKLGSTGAVGDRLDWVLVVPTATTVGAITVTDGDGTPVEIYHGGTVGADLKPFPIPYAKVAAVASSPGLTLSMGAGAAGIAFGDFT